MTTQDIQKFKFAGKIAQYFIDVIKDRTVFIAAIVIEDDYFIIDVYGFHFDQFFNDLKIDYPEAFIESSDFIDESESNEVYYTVNVPTKIVIDE